MSRYIKINNWSGPDFEGATACVAKVFRMEREEADSVMQDVSTGSPWQFQWTVPDEQALIANDYLNQWGFSLDLIEADRVDGPLMGQASAVRVEEPEPRSSWFASLFKKFQKPTAEQQPAAEERKSLFKKLQEPTAEQQPAAEGRKSLFSFFSKSRKEADASPPAPEVIVPPVDPAESETPGKKTFFGLFKKK